MTALTLAQVTTAIVAIYAFGFGIIAVLALIPGARRALGGAIPERDPGQRDSVGLPGDEPDASRPEAAAGEPVLS